AAEFAAAVGLPSPAYGGVGDETRYQLVAEQLRAQTGFAPNADAEVAYDALWVAALAAVTSGGIGNIDAYKLALDFTADQHVGIPGWTGINDTGDRALGEYDFWAIRDLGGEFRWVRVPRYKSLRIGPPQLVIK